MSSSTADMTENDFANPENDFANPEKQKSRSFLRERFLRVLSSVKDLDCNLHLYDKSTIKAKFGGPDIDFYKLFLKELETKASKYPQVLMRTSDILRIEIPKGSCQKLIEDQQESNEIEMKEA